MPELPEVETIRRDLEKELVGDRILALKTDTPKLFRPSFETVLKGVVGKTIRAVSRQAKLLYFTLDDDSYLAVHLKMTGRLLIRGVKEPRDEWERASFAFSSGKDLRFSDLRKFGYIQYLTEDELQSILLKYGPEPLKDLTFEDLKAAVSGRRRPIKALLLDQSLISGVGNIYANEALFRAKINPMKEGLALDDKEIALLYATLNDVIREAIASRGTTANDDKYVDAYGQKGHFQEKLLVYGRQNKPCPGCGATIKRVTLGGRGTFFCPKCQVL